jgi:hypothetical protein
MPLTTSKNRADQGAALTARLNELNANGPYTGALAITKSDDDDIEHPEPETSTRAIWVGGAGNLKVDLVSGSTVTFTSVPAGTELKIQATKVYSTDTTATNMVALY